MNKNRFEEIDKTIESSMRMKLNQIRTFLDLGKASVMVGAGFSKNAEMNEDVRMKDWSELCEDFYLFVKKHISLPLIASDGVICLAKKQSLKYN